MYRNTIKEPERLRTTSCSLLMKFFHTAVMCGRTADTNLCSLFRVHRGAMVWTACMKKFADKRNNLLDQIPEDSVARLDLTKDSTVFSSKTVMIPSIVMLFWWQHLMAIRFQILVVSSIRRAGFRGGCVREPCRVTRDGSRHNVLSARSDVNGTARCKRGDHHTR